jgi:hypothetical protein
MDTYTPMPQRQSQSPWYCISVNIIYKGSYVFYTIVTQDTVFVDAKKAHTWDV